MIDKKIVTPGALDLLRRIMQTCPSTVFNGGEHAKKHLHDLCKKGESVLGCQLREGISEAMTLLCGCEGEMDVYTHMLSNTEAVEVTEREIMQYFGGEIHAEKIFASARKDGFFPEYSLKVVYGHLLVPVTITKSEEIEAMDFNGIIIKNLLNLKGDEHIFSVGDLALMHYGFVIGKVSENDINILLEINKKSSLYLKAGAALNGIMDFAEMHYFPRSKEMTGK